jgi:hypothetical protein
MHGRSMRLEARYATRKQQLLAECQVAPESCAQGLPRLTPFMAPLVETCWRPELDPQAQTSLGGLLADVARNTIASLAYRFGQDRLPLQRFIGWAPWDEGPLRQELTRHVAEPWGHAEGVLVFDPSGCPTAGTESVGVARQWCGRLGQVDNCHGAVALGDVSGVGHTLGALRLSWPKAWTTDKARLDNAGVPHAQRGERSRHPVAWAMLQTRGTQLPPGWIAGDDELGRPYGLRRRLDRLGERSRLAGPGHPLLRALETAPLASSGRRRPPTPPWQRVEAWGAALDEDAWQRIDGRDGAQGPLVVERVQRRVVARPPRRQQGHEELCVVLRDRDRDNQQVGKVDLSLANAAPGTPLWQLARVAKAAPRIEACLQRSTSEAGVADYEVRNGTGWHQPQTLSLLATGFLVTETLRGKKMDASDDGPADTHGHRGALVQRVAVRDDSTSAA